MFKNFLSIEKYTLYIVHNYYKKNKRKNENINLHKKKKMLKTSMNKTNMWIIICMNNQRI